MRKLLVLVLPALLFCMTFTSQSAAASTDGITVQQLRERTDLRAAGRYAEGLDEFAAAMRSRTTCPVPGSEFVDSWHAPRAGHLHIGTDMMAPDGTPIIAIQAGTYRQHGAESFYLDGDDGTQWFGTHLQEHVAPDGTHVNAGDLVALVGHSGNASADGPHLHMELHPGGGEAAPSFATLAALCVGATAPSNVTAAPQERVYYQAPEPTFIYQTAEIQRHYNSTRPVSERIGRGQAIVLRRFYNAVTWQEVVAYVRAMTPDCRPGAPDACAAMIRQVFARYGLDGNAAVSVASCESGLNPTASNGGSYLGLFQQQASAWASRAARYGVAGRSAFDGEANAIVSAGMVRDDGDWGQWSCQP